MRSGNRTLSFGCVFHPYIAVDELPAKIFRNCLFPSKHMRFAVFLCNTGTKSIQLNQRFETRYFPLCIGSLKIPLNPSLPSCSTTISIIECVYEETNKTHYKTLSKRKIYGRSTCSSLFYPYSHILDEKYNPKAGTIVMLPTSKKILMVILFI